MPAGTPTYNDMYLLSQCQPFQNRVQAALVAGLISISNEAWSQNHYQRLLFVNQVFGDPANLSAFVLQFSMAAACDSTVISAATSAASNYTALTTGNVATQSALVTDSQILSAIANAANAFIRIAI